MCIFTSHFINLFFLNFFFLAFVRLGPRLGKFFNHVIKKYTKRIAEFRPKLFKGLWNEFINPQIRRCILVLILPRLPLFA